MTRRAVSPTSGLRTLLPYELAQLVVTYPGDAEQVLVEIAHFNYSGTLSSPIGPVLSLAELGSHKTCAYVLLTELPGPRSDWAGGARRAAH